MESIDKPEAAFILLSSLSESPTVQDVCTMFINKLSSDPDQSEGSFEFLVELLRDLKHTTIIARCFPGILLELLSSAIPLPLDKQDVPLIDRNYHRENCLILSKLIIGHPDVLQFSLQYFKKYPAPFDLFPDQPTPKKKKRFVVEISDEDLLESCYNFLKAAPDIFRNKWNWSMLLKNVMLSSDKPKVLWIVCQCISILLGYSEAQLHELESLALKNKNDVLNCLLREKCLDNVNPTSSYKVGSDLFKKVKSKPTVIDISGIQLPVMDTSIIETTPLVSVKSTKDNLRSIALAIASGNAISLVGPVGCGKTALVEHLASLTGRKKTHFKKVQLGDQTDSRMLLGTYRCTDIPGEFIWQPGVLTQAVQEGYWLLLEDINCAATDVASVLSSLLERNTLSVPGYRDSLAVAPGFQLFVTQRTLQSVIGQMKQSSNALALLQKHLTQINIEPLSRQELITVVETQFPKLKTIASRMVDVFMLFSVGSHQSSLLSFEENPQNPLVKTISAETSEILSLKSGRLTSTRDLMKWCQRSVKDFNISSKDSALKVLRDAIDIFVGSVPEYQIRLPLAKAIGAFLGIVETEAEYYCNSYKPNVSLQPLTMHIGRTNISRKNTEIADVNLSATKCKFSFTRQSTCLLESVTCCVNANEPVLLVGETGTGKTSSIQYLARETGNKLIVINMNQQSDSADLLGGYKPVDLKYVILPIKNEFVQLFTHFFDSTKNAKFLQHISNTFFTSDWKTLLVLMIQSQKAAVLRLRSVVNGNVDKSDADSKTTLLKRWLDLGVKLSKLDLQIKSQASLAFSFIEGSLVKALQKGYWVLLDEINLASSETLECLSMLLEGKDGSINLLERGDETAIKRHSNFTLFACMNPATDVGKRDLPAGLRNRFTEFYVEELTNKQDLLLLVKDYLVDMSVSQATVESIYKFYITIKKEAKIHLMDGTGQSPHYSLRTLCRALSAAPLANCGTVTRSLYETMCLSFLTQLDSASHPKVLSMIASAVLGKKTLKSVLNQSIPEPKADNKTFIQFEGYWICQGQLKPDAPYDYVLTPTVRKNLCDLVRIISFGKLPILLQGDTSVGKTSLITYIAKASGNHCVRINNHQHTDLQEYVGSYATDANGKLVFKEGILVEAMRKGHWIILDELNLAPSDVLEALNRVLDDNRELFIPETQQVVRADPNFMLFATQNPPGLYGGRKLLSRAFRNRFVELHFDDIPRLELEIILHERCHMPPSYCRKIVAVMAELQARRKGSAAVQGKEGFITLRDLFRWGQRYKIASNKDTLIGKYYDWDQHIADEGYLVLAGRVRKSEERYIIQEVLEKHLKRTVNPENLFTLSETTSPVTKDILSSILNSKISENHIVWTFNMRRLAVLIAKSFVYNEPVLLVGETGCGKTTVCQILSELRKCQLLTVNCHMYTESSDFLGGLRPVRQHKQDGQLFEWVDGPLVNALRSGDMFLADEISLADDSVLERLNSLLEHERQLLIAEKTLDLESDTVCVITAKDGFQFISTMNPGGDYGKKELSPALRNRFTEIWCDHVSSREDLLAILEKSIIPDIKLKTYENDSGIGKNILEFVDWLKATKVGERYTYSIRDLLTWVNFINTAVKDSKVDVAEAYVHGACMTFLDCLGTGNIRSEDCQLLESVRYNAVKKLLSQCDTNSKLTSLLDKNYKLSAQMQNGRFGIPPFYIQKGSNVAVHSENFNFTSPTTGLNTMRLLRGLQLKKPILLEGSPGVGKTSLVTALAKISSHKILRINLSDQTDISDLFGADLPTKDGTFAWQEGAFLTALQTGTWILLDELNLAPQPVLEGLNACLDHRSEIFIPELDKTFKVNPDTKIFACQNPLRQGGARRGLPQSFLNRFTQVYIETLTSEDLFFITSSLYGTISHDVLRKMITMNEKILKETTDLMLWGHRGSPWELNLRDIQRWCDGIMSDSSEINPAKFAKLLYIDRMRTTEDKDHVRRIYHDLFCPEYPLSSDHPLFNITEKYVEVGDVSVYRRDSNFTLDNGILSKELLILRNQLPILKALIQCVNMNWLSILVGPTATGKSSCVEVLAQLTGNILKILPVTSAMDTTDVLGGFEQTDFNRHLENISIKVQSCIITAFKSLMSKNHRSKAFEVLSQWEVYQNIDRDGSTAKKTHTMEDETKIFFIKQSHLQNLINSLIVLNENEPTTKDILLNISTELQRLSKLVVEEGSINAGGKFEWVDSLLVKCLLEGHWLLIENVNLCSSAVLDRLNGLLEPNGYLSIPERGGHGDEIRPHPNFRMFFAMDPKNGEISRAMRNRGVEIFIVGNEGTSDYKLSEKMSSLDISALMSSKGLESSYHNIFMKIHEKLTSFVQGYDKPSLCHLLQAAFLTSQQLLRGENIAESVKNSFSDIYIKSRSVSDFIGSDKTLSENKNEMLLSLNNLIKEELSKEIKKYSNQFSRQHTLISSNLRMNSSLDMLLQDAFCLSQSIANRSVFLNFEDFVKIAFLFYKFYSGANSDDLQLRNEICRSRIDQFVTKENVKEWIFTLNDQITEVYSNHPSFDLSIDDVEINKLAILSYFSIVRAIQNHPHEKLTSSLTAYEYSKSIMSKKIADLSHILVIKHCSSVISNTDNFVTEVIKNDKSSLSQNTWAELFSYLLWRNRFLKVCNEPLFVLEKNKAKLLKEDVVINIEIHYKWLVKYLIKRLKTITKSSKAHSRDFDKLLLTINNSLQSQSSPLRPISKHLRKKMGQPSPFENADAFKNFVTKEIFLKKSSILNPNKHGKFTKDSLQCLLDHRYLKLSLNFEDIWSSSSDAVSYIEDLMQSFDKEIQNQIDLSSEDSYKLKNEVQLWPIKDFVILKVINLLKIKFFESADKNSFPMTISKIFEYLAIAVDSVPTIDAKLRILILESQKIFNEGSLDKNNLILFENAAEIMDLFTKYLEYCPATNYQSWINFDVKNLESDGDYSSNSVGLNLPHLTLNTLEIIMHKPSQESDDNSEIPSALLGYKDRSKQLYNLHNILYENMLMSNVKSFNYSYSDAKMLIVNYGNFISNLNLSLNRKTIDYINPTDINLQNMASDCSKQIENCFTDDEDCSSKMIDLKNHICESLTTGIRIACEVEANLDTVVDNDFLHFQIGQSWTLLAFCQVAFFGEIGPMDPIRKEYLKHLYIKEDNTFIDLFLNANMLDDAIKGTIQSTNRELNTLLRDNLCEPIFDSDNCQIMDRSAFYEKHSYLHPYYELLVKARKLNSEKINRQTKGYTYRPPNVAYLSIFKEFCHFSNSIASPKILAKHYDQLVKSFKTLSDAILFKIEPNANDLKIANDAIRECSLWQFSVRGFYAKICNAYSSAYPDILKPFLNAITQLLHGLNMMKNSVVKALKQLSAINMNELMENLVRFPIINDTFNNNSHVADFLMSKNLIDFVKLNMKSLTDSSLTTREPYRLLMISLKEIFSGCLVRGSLDEKLWDGFNSILNEAVITWQKQETAIEKKKQEDESLYVTKTKCEQLTEEEEDEIEKSKLFPSYSDVDFVDFRTALLEQPKSKSLPLKKIEDETILLTEENLIEIVAVHSQLVKKLSSAEWLPISGDSKLNSNYLSLLIERYETFYNLMGNLAQGLNTNIDRTLMPSLMIFVAHARSSIDGEDYLEVNSYASNKKPNFYHDPWPTEVQRCFNILEETKMKTIKLLEEWPDFPILKDILIVVTRILGFPVTSPIIRFLTGVELLRDKVEEWNKAAHRENNMNDIALSLAQQIVSWRKLELNSWRDSLTNTYESCQNEAYKYWFHIFVLIDCYISEKPLLENKIGLNVETGVKMTSFQFISAMQTFIEKSSIGQFFKRMDILYSFHCYITHFKQSTKRDEVLSILWNLHIYYSQFSSQIETAIKDKRTPIEKKLRDFVKICSWDRDLSYWAVKDIVDKAHKTLVKHIKEFKTALEDKVNTYFSLESTETMNSSVGIWDRPKRVASSSNYYFMVDPTHHIISPRMIKKYLEELSNPELLEYDSAANASLMRISSLVNKAKTLCKDTVTNSPYPGLLQTLDSFISEIIDASKRLRDLEVSKGIPKEKQKTQAKGFLQQKKKALADLFKTLTKIGVSYRTGIVENTVRRSNIVNFTVTPIDLKASLAYLKNKRCDTPLLSLWDGCEMYYQKCIAHIGTLMASLVTPHADLGPQNIDRCKGFSIHLMLMVQDQKSKLSKSSRLFCTFRNQVNQITALCESNFKEYNQSLYNTKLESFLDLFGIIILAMEQFKLVLKAYPSKNMSYEASLRKQLAFDTALSGNCMLKCYKNDIIWNEAIDKVRNVINSSIKHKNNLIKVKSNLPSVCQSKSVQSLTIVISQSDEEMIKNASSEIENIITEISSLKNLYEIEESEYFGTMSNPLVSPLVTLENKISQELTRIQTIESEIKSKLLDEDNLYLSQFNTKVEDLTNCILFTIQEIYKKHTREEKPDEDLTKTAVPDKTDEEEEDDVSFDIKDNHLREELQEKLFSNINELNLTLTINKINNLLSDFVNHGETTKNIELYKQSLSRCVPLLEQLSLLSQFYLTQQVATHRVSCKMLSVISSIFKELSTKGFCIPSGLDLESGEGKGQSSAGGMGLGDGEGEKDVSERIENQDQLEDAHRAGEEKQKQDDKDCKEEDKGIDMTDDFESHLQDVEKKEGEEDDDKSDEEDADKQMGDTEMGADKLDQQIWGSDDEEDNENEKDNEDNEKGQGKTLDDKQFGAKENNDQEDEDTSNTNDDKKNKKKDINEMEEPEGDDDHVDPYHGNQKPLPEPEPMELPNDMNMEQEKENEEEEEENGENPNDPFELNKFEDKEELSETQDDKTDKEQNDSENKNPAEDNDFSDEGGDENDAEDDNPVGQPENEDEIIDDSLDNKENPEDTTEEPVPENTEDDKETPKVSEEPQKSKDKLDEDKPPEEENPDVGKDQAKPSKDSPTAEDNVESSETNDGSKDTVETNPCLDKEDQNAPFEQSQEQEGDEKDGTGQSELSENQMGHQSNKMNIPRNNAKDDRNSETQKKEKRNKPGITEEERALGEVKEPVQKKMKILNTQDKNEVEENEDDQEPAIENDEQGEADIFQHVKQAKETDIQAIDAATKEQAESQPVPNQPEEEGDETNPDDDVLMDTNEDVDMDDSKAEEIKPEKVSEDKKLKKDDKISKTGDEKTDNLAEDATMEMEGDNIDTSGVQRGAETTYHTKIEKEQGLAPLLSTENIGTRISVQDNIVITKSISSENTTHWHTLWGQTSEKARMLTEKLRLVLEPTGISRLAGDYRTGRRINMRRVIPYIASHFRKDRIWLRRTRPAKREYQIAVAIDDSSSMSDNQSKEMAFESLALVSQALNLLEAGELAVLSFGESSKVLHSFSEQFTESSGSKLLENLTFQQTKTKIAQLLDFSAAMFEEQSKASNALNAKLLLIVSDGRGIFSEGQERVMQAVRRARHKGIFMVYLIVDNPENKQSIMDIRSPIFDPETKKLESLKPYLDTFPFPFYLILRDIVALPAVLSDALRQWFELAANSDKM